MTPAIARPEAKLGLEDLRVDSFVTTSEDWNVEAGKGTYTCGPNVSTMTCGMTCGSATCDTGGGTGCCPAASSCCGSC